MKMARHKWDNSNHHSLCILCGVTRTRYGMVTRYKNAKQDMEFKKAPTCLKDMETITVTILPGGKKAKEVKHEKEPKKHHMESWRDFYERRSRWHSSESKLRTFDIENIMLLSDPPQMKYKEGQIFEAQIINETKIRIV